ncbi:MAG: hypothetical protein H0T58_09605 [Gemmatimonadales bacterium]|nr:hypothetical protein [Gemmatimonadales bacterium]
MSDGAVGGGVGLGDGAAGLGAAAAFRGGFAAAGAGAGLGAGKESRDATTFPGTGAAVVSEIMRDVSGGAPAGPAAWTLAVAGAASVSLSPQPSNIEPTTMLTSVKLRQPPLIGIIPFLV